MRVFLLVLLAAVVGSCLGLASRVFFREKASFPPSVVAVPPSPASSDPGDSRGYPPAPDVAAPHPVGYIVGRGRVQVVMSDGTSRTERDPELGVLQRNSVFLDGKKQFIRARFAATVPPPSAAAVVTLPPEHVNPQELRSQVGGGGSWLPPDGYGVVRLRDRETLSANK